MGDVAWKIQTPDSQFRSLDIWTPGLALQPFCRDRVDLHPKSGFDVETDACPPRRYQQVFNSQN